MYYFWLGKGPFLVLIIPTFYKLLLQSQFPDKEQK